MRYKSIFIILVPIILVAGYIKGEDLSNSSPVKKRNEVVLKEVRGGKEIESVRVELIDSYCKDDRRAYILKVKTRSPFWNNLDCSYNNAWKVFELIGENEFLPQSVEDVSKEFSRKENLSDSEKVYRIVFYDNCSKVKGPSRLVLKFILGVITFSI